MLNRFLFLSELCSIGKTFSLDGRWYNFNISASTQMLAASERWSTSRISSFGYVLKLTTAAEEDHWCPWVLMGWVADGGGGGWFCLLSGPLLKLVTNPFTRVLNGVFLAGVFFRAITPVAVPRTGEPKPISEKSWCGASLRGSALFCGGLSWVRIRPNF